MRSVLGNALQGRHDHCFYAGIIDRARRAGTGLVTQAIHPVLGKTAAPFADRRTIQAQPGGHIFVLRAVRAGQHDPSPQRERLRRLAAARQ
jgi:hypothetical protein